MSDAHAPSLDEAFIARRSARKIVGFASVAIFLGAWQFLGAAEIVRSDLISYPTEIASAAADLVASDDFGKHIATSLREFANGLAPAFVVGVLLGLAFALSRILRYLFEPLFVAMYTAPLISFVPILVVWFGVGVASKSVVAFLAAVVPVTINTATGARETEEAWIRALRAFGASRAQIIAKAIIPGALPFIMAGARLAIGRAIVGLIGAEMYVSVFGVGRLMQTYGSAARAAELFVLVILVSGFGFVCIGTLRLLENWLLPWRARA